MLLPMKWLQKYITLDNPDVQAYAKSMIMAGNAVEDVKDLGAEIDKVVVGRILEVVKHPDSDHLSVCQVDVGQEEPVQIVTGANNMQAGDYVPVALDGSHLPGGVKIKKGKLRGVVSNGMMCSGEELGVPQEVYPSNTDHGLLILQGEPTIGEDIKPVLGLDEQVVDFEILANRPDCLSVLGLAYESAAAAGGTMKELKVQLAPMQGDVNEHVRIDVEDETLCRRYCARVVKNIKIEPSPLWMRQFLHAAGVRPINNIVDITNFVMLEMGQPMHAFDLDSVAGRHIIVRKAGDTKQLRTLDGKDRQLSPEMLVIADESGATGLAGVMGGEGSEITENTKLVLFESACFDGASIRQTGRALGLRTEAQGRFEHGVNEKLVRLALDRAVQLVQELGAGEVVDGVIDIYPNPKPEELVKAPIGYVQTLMGIDVPPEEMVAILEKLCIRTTISGDCLLCTPPVHRQDIHSGADIAEEVLRLYGYDNIPETSLRGEVKGGRLNATLERNSLLRPMLLGFGLYETVSYSFISPKWLDWLRLPQDAPERKAARILNPIGEDYSIMRTTLIPSLLNTMGINYSRSRAAFGCFELGVRFLPKALPLTEQPEERPSLCLGAYGGGMDFYRLKGLVETIFERFGLEGVRFERSSAAYLHPGRAAQAVADGQVIAVLGQAHPDVAERFALEGEAYVAELDLEALDRLSGLVGKIKAPARFPMVQRDMALVMDESVAVGELLEELKRCAGKLCQEARLFDIYRGHPIAKGQKSVAISLMLQAEDRTLTDAEINAIFDKCLEMAKAKFNAVLRS